MKQYLSVLAIFTFFLLAIPGVALLKPGSSPHSNSFYDSVDSSGFTAEPSSHEILESTDAGLSPSSASNETFLVLDKTTGNVMEIGVRDYMIGAVCAEMPASFQLEALKAQAVAAHTYAERQKERESLHPTEELKGAYFSNDSSKYQAYFTPEQAKQFYGDKYEESRKKIESAVDSVLNEILVYGGEPIVAAFHSMSSGKTESAQVIWGTGADYLVPVESPENQNSPGYQQEITMTPDELSARLANTYEGIKLPSEKTEWIIISERSESGTVTRLKAGGKELTGMELRTLLGLRSADFDITYQESDELFHITTRGYGHGVGLSQYGANMMAAEGKSYQDILTHYYQGATLVSVDQWKASGTEPVLTEPDEGSAAPSSAS